MDLAALMNPWVLGLLEVAWVLGVGVWLVLERRSPTATLAWILALAVLPLLGVPVYLLLGPRRLERKKLRMALARHACECYLDAFDQRPGHTVQEQLLALATRLGGTPPQTAQACTLFTEGDACTDALVAAIGAARHHVHAEYYIFADDRTGTRLRDALVERARAGVEVRLLVDAAGSAGTPTRFFDPLVAAGGSVERFNPVFLRRWRRPVPNFRTHRKIVVCDGTVGFTGGMNACDHASRAAQGEAAWRDTHLRLEGAAVHGLQLTFLENWVFATGREEMGEGSEVLERRRSYFPPAEPGALTAQVISSGPDHEPHAIHGVVFAAIAGARERVWLTTPYFVPDEALLTALATAAQRGVDVRLLVPRETDAFLVDAAGETLHAPLKEAGVQVFLYGPPMVHAKTWLVDRDLAIVGTANCDNRSFRLNFEVVVALHDAGVAGQLATHFESDLQRAQPSPAAPSRSFGRRLVTSAARLLAPQL